MKSIARSVFILLRIKEEKLIIQKKKEEEREVYKLDFCFSAKQQQKTLFTKIA